MGYPPQNQNQYQYPYPNMAAPPAKKKRGGCLSCLLTFVIGLLVLVALVVGVYLLFKSGVITERQVLALMGKTPGEVSIYNLTDGQLSVTLDSLDQSSTSNTTFTVNNNLTLQPMDIDGFTMDPGRYTLSFSSSPGSSACTLKIAGGDFVRFAVSPSGAIVTSDAHPSKTDADLRLETSPLCHQ